MNDKKAHIGTADGRSRKCLGCVGRIVSGTGPGEQRQNKVLDAELTPGARR
jgi:hypothetical protein